MLEVEGVSKKFVKGVLRGQTVEAVKEVSFSLPEGKTLGIVGNSGCGKTTLARILLSLLTPDRGSVRIDGEELFSKGKNRDRARTRKIQMIFQNPESSPSVSGSFRFPSGEAIGKTAVSDWNPKRSAASSA